MSMMYILILVDLHLKYYTDQHDVDDDNRAIPSYGERWCGIIYAGMYVRHVNTNPINASEFVAYKYNKNSTPVLRVEF